MIMQIITIILGVSMGLFFLAYVFFLLIDHFSYVEGYDNPKDVITILKRIFGYGFLILLILFILAVIIYNLNIFG